MPRFIGNTIKGSQRIEDNADCPADHVRLTYAQAVKLAPSAVKCSLDTSDRGGRGRKAKRWFRWLAPASDVLATPGATTLMRAKAEIALVRVARGAA